jgi:hypothetical protein
MTIALYHGTSAANAEQVLRLGFRDERRNFMTDEELIGVWLSERPLDEHEDASNEVYLHTEFNCSVDALQQYELLKDSQACREWVMPAAFVNSHATVKLALFPA